MNLRIDRKYATLLAPVALLALAACAGDDHATADRSTPATERPTSTTTPPATTEEPATTEAPTTAAAPTTTVPTTPEERFLAAYDDPATGPLDGDTPQSALIAGQQACNEAREGQESWGVYHDLTGAEVLAWVWEVSLDHASARKARAAVTHLCPDQQPVLDEALTLSATPPPPPSPETPMPVEELDALIGPAANAWLAAPSGETYDALAAAATAVMASRRQLSWDQDNSLRQLTTYPGDDFTVELHLDDLALPSVSLNMPWITWSEFDAIEIGMSIEEVRAIVGSGGELMSESRLAGYHTALYGWDSEYDVDLGYQPGNANVMFQNGAVVSKAQFGL